MKIAILTHPLMYNYGGILQNYALQQYLLRKGYEVKTINRIPDYSHPITIYNIYNYVKRVFLHMITFKDINIYWNPNLPIKRSHYNIISKEIKIFTKNHIVSTCEVLDKEIKALDEIEKFDTYIVGSDQVWHPGCSLLMFLDFCKRDNVRKITYAASAGNQSWVDYDNLRGLCKELSKSFKALSAREEHLALEASLALERNVDWVLDPSFLLTQKDYDIMIRPTINYEKRIFSYILDSDEKKCKLELYLSQKLNMPVETGFVFNKKKLVPLPSVDNWINAIKTSSFIITDSFHGCVFSIIYHKQFIAIDNIKRGSKRIFSLLKLFNLENRIISNPSEIMDCINNAINYALVEKKLEKRRLFSRAFLDMNLEQ